MHPIRTFDYEDDLYTSVTLEVEPEDNGLFKFSMHWNSDKPFEAHINLSNMLGLEYYDNTSYWADALPKNEEQQELRRKLQKTTGEQLAQGIFVGEIADALKKLAVCAKNKTILLTLVFQSGVLDVIPWELLGEPQNSYISNCQFLSVSVSRGVFHNKPRIPKAKGKVLISYITSQPTLYPALHSEKEKKKIEENIRGSGKADLTSYPSSDVTHKRFHTYLRETRPHILHMALHGDKGKLLFSRDDDDQPIPFSTLTKDILEINSIGLAVFNICYSSAPQDNEVYLSGLPRQLVEMGMPCSIGMTTKVTDRAVLEFTDWLYDSFSDDKTVRIAFSRAIEELRNYNKFDNILWSVPMLVLNQDVIPFVNFLEKIEIAPEKPEIDHLFFEKISTACTECINAYQEIYPSQTWNALTWKNNTSYFISRLGRAQILLSPIKQKIPATNHLKSRDVFCEILQIVDVLSPDLKDVLECKPDDLDFMKKASLLLQKFVRLQESLKKICR